MTTVQVFFLGDVIEVGDILEGVLSSTRKVKLESPVRFMWNSGTDVKCALENGSIVKYVLRALNSAKRFN